MNLREILAISGASGLYKYVAQSKSGIIVESLTDGKRTMANASAKVSALGDIAVFTDAEEIPLGDLFQNVYDLKGGEVVALNGKSTPAELQAFMEEVLPNYDRDRVHNSDIKKIAAWYNILIGAGMTDFKVEEEQEEQEVEE